ncbi:VOC family protein [Nesterenkonia flava]|uniref:VOC family protein n=1 Tax=Nesterenkonia flava TaxID=469799 RepID=A0ABU1FQT0_9MICC|nr:VOC family protein [Nesterenkonia flava]MDR5710999.1 VOC family protein [Nesterenkonia flava]
MNIAQLYDTYLPQAEALIDSLGVREELVQNDTLCLQVPSNERYDQVKAELTAVGTLISESEINGRLIAVFELHTPLSGPGWSVSFVELPQPKSGAAKEGVRHLQFVTRTSSDSFRAKFPHLTFDERGNARNRLLEVVRDGVAVRFHDKSMGAVVALEQAE